MKHERALQTGMQLMCTSYSKPCIVLLILVSGSIQSIQRGATSSQCASLIKFYKKINSTIDVRSYYERSLRKGPRRDNITQNFVEWYDSNNFAESLLFFGRSTR